MKAVLADVGPLADAATERAAGRGLHELPDDEFSVLAEPGTVGASLRHIWQLCADTPDVSAKHVAAALHHRRPELFPLLVRTTRWQLLPHVREGDSGPEAVVHRELRGERGGVRGAASRRWPTSGLTVLRLHDVLLWLSASLRLTHAVELGRTVARPV